MYDFNIVDDDDDEGDSKNIIQFFENAMLAPQKPVSLLPYTSVAVNKKFPIEHFLKCQIHERERASERMSSALVLVYHCNNDTAWLVAIST